MLRRLSTSSLNARNHYLPRCFATSVNQRIRCFATAVNQTNIGYCRLAFNVGAGDQLPLRARIFDTPTGQAFKASLPYQVPSLNAYGDEVYGGWKVTLPSTKPQPMIPPGGLAYSAQGNYLCVFFGQAPAWPVVSLAEVHTHIYLQYSQAVQYANSRIPRVAGLLCPN